MLTAKMLAERVEQLVTLPGVYLEVKRLIADPDSGLSDIGSAVSQDPALTARLLRIANSSYFGMASEIGTVTRAISLLGTEQLHDLILATAVAESLSQWPESGLDMADFWHRSVYCGTAARQLAHHCNDLDSERLFVAGLLHDIGLLVMWQTIPDKMVQLNNSAVDMGRSIHRIEQEQLGFTRAEVGGALLSAWQLPRLLQEAVTFYPRPYAAPQFSFEAAIVHVASVITLVSGKEEPPAILRRLSTEVAMELQLDADVIGKIISETDQQLDEVMALFTPSPHPAAR